MTAYFDPFILLFSLFLGGGGGVNVQNIWLEKKKESCRLYNNI